MKQLAKSSHPDAGTKGAEGAEGSGRTFLESALNGSSPDAVARISSGSNDTKNHSYGDNDETSNQTVAAHIAWCRSLVNGWYNPETGLVVCCGKSSHQSPQSNGRSAHATDSVDLEKGEDGGTCSAPSSSPSEIPFYAVPTCTSIPYLVEGSVSAEGLLARHRMGAAEGVTENVNGKLLTLHDSTTYYGDRENLKFLEEGGVFYSFTCRTWMMPYEREMVKTMVNMSGFEDETEANFVPAFDIDNPDDVRRYTYILQRSAYLLPGAHLNVFTPELLSGTDYHRQCQPSGTKIWEQREPNSFRFTRPIVAHVYHMTIQFKVSEIGRKDLHALSRVMGVRVDHGILMERTKRSIPPKIDATAKAKSILCYTAVPGGVLVNHSTVILNTSLASIIARIIHTFGSMGLHETCETAERTRCHMLNLISESFPRERH